MKCLSFSVLSFSVLSFSVLSFSVLVFFGPCLFRSLNACPFRPFLKCLSFSSFCLKCLFFSSLFVLFVRFMKGLIHLGLLQFQSPPRPGVERPSQGSRRCREYSPGT